MKHWTKSSWKKYSTHQQPEWPDDNKYKKISIRGICFNSKKVKKRDVFFKDLVVSSFLEQETASNIKITKEQIREYYIKNKTAE